MKPYRILLLGIGGVFCALAVYVVINVFHIDYGADEASANAKDRMAEMQAIHASSASISESFKPGQSTEFASPFGTIPEAQKNEPAAPAAEISVPLIKNIPSVPLPLLTAEKPQSQTSSSIKIIGLIPSTGKRGQAIISNGAEQLIVDEGSSTKWGFVSGITKHGLSINGSFIPIDGSSTALPIIRNATMLQFLQ